MATYKIGATVQILLQMDQEEFDAIYPHTSFMAEAEITGGQEYQLTPTIDVLNRSILLTANTTGWQKGQYKCDIRIVKNGMTLFIPADSYITFNLVPPVTETANEVNT